MAAAHTAERQALKLKLAAQRAAAMTLLPENPRLRTLKVRERLLQVSGKSALPCMSIASISDCSSIINSVGDSVGG